MKRIVTVGNDIDILDFGFLSAVSGETRNTKPSYQKMLEMTTGGYGFDSFRIDGVK